MRAPRPFLICPLSGTSTPHANAEVGILFVSRTRRSIYCGLGWYVTKNKINCEPQKRFQSSEETRASLEPRRSRSVGLCRTLGIPSRQDTKSHIQWVFQVSRVQSSVYLNHCPICELIVRAKHDANLLVDLRVLYTYVRTGLYTNGFNTIPI